MTGSSGWRPTVASAGVFQLSGVEMVGYVASVLVVLSLAMTSVVRLRILSLAGGITFVVYGALIDSAPIVITNGAIAAINVWFLRKEFGAASGHGVDLGASRIRPDSPFLVDFVRYHLNDIHRFQPDFQHPSEVAAADDVFALLLTRDAAPAGLILGRRDDGCLVVDLDYVLAPYRDSRLGRWLYGRGADVFRNAGFTSLRAHARTDTHRHYLERVGFSATGDHHTLNL